MFLPFTLFYKLGKRIPRVLVLITSFISVFLLVFLLVGCYNVDQSSTYLVKYQFNDKSPLYPVISNQFSSQEYTDGLENVQIFSGYMGICINNIPSNYDRNSSSKSSKVCFNRKKVDDMDIFDDLTIKIFSFKNSNSTEESESSNLNILELAHQNSDELVHPYLLMVVTIFTILLFGITVYAIIPKLPFKNYVQFIIMGLSALITLLWAIGAIWTHVAINCNVSLIPRASMNIMTAEKGSKSQALSWTVFTFMLIDCLIMWMVYFRDRKKLDEKLDDVKSTKNPFSNKYASDTTLSSV